MAEATQTEKEASVRVALEQLSLDTEDIKEIQPYYAKLYDQGYRTARHFRRAQRKSLKEVGLPLVFIDAIEHTQQIPGTPLPTIEASSGVDLALLAPALPYLDISECVACLKHDGITIGTVIRVSSSGTCLTCRHCVAQDGSCLQDLSAFGSPLRFKAAFPKHDVAVMEGAPGPALNIGTAAWMFVGQPGRGVKVVSYPRAVDVEMEGGEDSGPTYSEGKIATVSRNQMLAAADVSAGMPSSSGGAVLFSEAGVRANVLAGMHIGIIYHREDYFLGSTSSSTRNTSSSGSNCAVIDDDTMETDPGRLTKDDEDDLTPDTTAKISYANIGHKGMLGIFIPAPVLIECLDRALGRQADELAVAVREARRSARIATNMLKRYREGKD